jgi:ATP-dependent helicase HrpB
MVRYRGRVNPEPLPVDEILAPLLRALRSARAVVVEAPPASGGATRLACALLEAGWGAEREIWVTQPRAVAAQLAADFVAAELGESVGQRVGYQLRFEQCAGPQTRLRFVTDQVLLERLTSAERGTGIGLVVLDQFHERRLAADLGLLLLRRRLKADAGLRIVVLSASRESAAVAAYLGDGPILRCSENVAPVAIEHEAEGESPRALHVRVAGAVERLVRSHSQGDILAFLPGPAQIEQAQQALGALAAERALELVALHGELPLELALRALTPGQRRRVLLSTAVAESSLTVEGVSAVVDSGLARRAEYSPWSDRRQLVVRPISQASAARRACRAGSSGQGQVVRLYSEASLAAAPEHEQPELQRLDLTGALLTLYACKVPLSPGLWLDAPSDAALDQARAQLERLGLASGDRVTDLGRRASLLAVPPRLALVALTGAELGIPRRVCLAVALLAERDMREGAAAREAPARSEYDCDIEQLIGLYTAAAAERFVPAALRRLGLCWGRVETVRRSYEQLLRNVTARNPAAEEDTLDAAAQRRALGLALLAGFPERVACRRESGQGELLLATGHVAGLAAESVASRSPLLLALDVEAPVPPDARAGAGAPHAHLRVRLAAALADEWLIEHAPQGLSERELLEWQDEREAAILISQLCWGEVVLRQSTRPAYPGIATGVLVERAALGQLATLFAKADTLPEIVARSELVAEHLPELGLQRVNELGTRGLLHAACARVISLAELRELDWRAVFLEQLSPEQRRELERQAPEHIVLKGGRRLRVRYARGQAPFIESRLQDFFGMSEGPALVHGRVPLSLHLLAPNQRAVQITADLAGFWQRDYAGLRRELSRRYPRDAWPEEPRTATAPRAAPGALTP